MKDKLAKLINVKSIVTIVLTLVFAGLSAFGKVSPEQFITIFTVIISFYFGTQFQKKQAEINNPDDTDADTDADTGEGAE